MPARIPHEELESLLRGYGYTVHTVEGHDPKLVHQQRRFRRGAAGHAGTRILRTAVRTPRMNAICKRLAGTLDLK